ncbi:hypothetical protein Bca52824_060934 [Brassica carinata]|uniref:Uncharacterized protein n=1 Tax=Brassica carinata TaxID=52824 RepID=A0A8X7R4H5_BRACI|nr:hypothetical protein Bca52824_060934 [Brassica carinata]
MATAGDSETASWRSDLSKVDVWYASFGSNMWKPRFLCYIQGGQVSSLVSRHVLVQWIKLHQRKQRGERFFGREYTVTWGEGGSAFLNPLTNLSDQTHMCFYRITLEQFNDVLFQENGMKVDSDSPLFDLSALQLVQNNGSIPLAKAGWYGNVVCVGKETDIPILTMTCTLSVLEKFTSGDVPLKPPAKAYANTLVMGLVEGGRLSEEEAWAYIDNAASKSL